MLQWDCLLPMTLSDLDGVEVRERGLITELDYANMYF